MTTPIRYMEVTYRGTRFDELNRIRNVEDTTVWAYTEPANLERDLRDTFGDDRYVALQQQRIGPKDAYRAEFWGSEGHKQWTKDCRNERFAFSLGPYVFPDMTSQKA